MYWWWATPHYCSLPGRWPHILLVVGLSQLLLTHIILIVGFATTAPALLIHPDIDITHFASGGPLGAECYSGILYWLLGSSSHKLCIWGGWNSNLLTIIICNHIIHISQCFLM